MKQFSIKSMTASLLLCSICFFSCNNSHPESKAKFDTVTVNGCLLNCATKEKACWDEYEKCKSDAIVERNAAMNTCTHLPPANQRECKNEALSEYIAKLDQCEKKLKACLTIFASCRDACINQFTIEHDNTK